MATEFHLVEKAFEERLRYLQAELAVMLQSSELSDLIRSGCYDPEISLVSAFQATSEAINAWKLYQQKIQNG